MVFLLNYSKANSSDKIPCLIPTVFNFVKSLKFLINYKTNYFREVLSCIVFILPKLEAVIRTPLSYFHKSEFDYSTVF